MTTTHSPAPWFCRISVHDPEAWEIRAQFCDSPIAEVPRWRDDGIDSPEAAANLALMTFAPRLFETLRFVAELLGSFKPDYLRTLGLDALLAEVADTVAAVEAITLEHR